MRFNGKNELFRIVCQLLLISIFIISILMISVFKYKTSFDFAAILSILSTLLGFILIRLDKRINNYGIFFVLFLYFTLTHFGASSIFLISPETIINKYKEYNYEWLLSDYCVLAIFYCIIAQIMFIFSGIFFGKRLIKNENKSFDYKEYKSKWIVIIGFLCVTVVLIYFLINVLSGGISLTKGYTEFKEWRSSNGYISIALFLLATGYLMVMSTGNKREIISINILFSIIGFILFLTGNKGEVLYAALAGVGVYYSRFKTISRNIIILLIILFFILVPFISSSRSTSIVSSFNDIGISIYEPFLETGWQLRTVETVVSWNENGQELGRGISYFAPIERIVSTLTLGIIPSIPISGTSWSFGERLPGWGFSQVAESYYNFSFIGPIIFYIIQGWFAVKAENQQVTPYRKAFYSSIVVILMILTRNRFSFVPGQIIMVLFLISACYLLDGRINGKPKEVNSN